MVSSEKLIKDSPLLAWMEVHSDPSLETDLGVVGWRLGEHSHPFTQQILGLSVSCGPPG